MSAKDKYGNPLQTYTRLTPCTIVGQQGPQCPPGWESVGYTQPGSCFIGNVPGDGHKDEWQIYGYNRVCKKSVPTTGDLAVDCCSNLFDVAGSLECSSSGYTPYNDTCNNVMQNKCNADIQKNPYSPEWNGIPGGQDGPVYNACTQTTTTRPPGKQPGCVDEFCINYLRNAPPNNFYHTHDYQDYGRLFPRYSYTTPDFAGTWGYFPMRTPYTSYRNHQQYKTENTYCQQFPQECFPNNYRLNTQF